MTRTDKKSNKNLQNTNKEHQLDQRLISYRCPSCQQQIITIKGELIEDLVMTCPKCRQKGIMRPLTRKQEHQLDQPQFSYMCPSCQQQIVTIQDELSEELVMTCPKCGQNGIMRPLQKKWYGTTSRSIWNRNQIEQRKTGRILGVEIKLVGILLIILGIVLHFGVNLVSLKMSYVLMIIGVIIFTFIPSSQKQFFTMDILKTKSNTFTQRHPLRTFYNDASLFKQFDISEKIAIVLILWIILIYLITGLNDIDLFFIFTYLGILVVKVFSNEWMSVHVRKRMNIFTLAFLCIFLFIVIRRILLIANVLS